MEELSKSNLILAAQLLREQARTDEAAAKFAEAARIEECLGLQYAAQGQSEKANLHRYSAMSLWAQAGNFYQAIALGDELLASADLLERLHQRIQSYTQTLRQRRARWREELGLERAA
jgi:hypothetical protein